MKVFSILAILMITGCASNGPETPLTYFHPDMIDQDIPRLTKRIGELESRRVTLLIELGDKVSPGNHLQSRINTHSHLRHAEWELEQDIRSLKQLRGPQE